MAGAKFISITLIFSLEQRTLLAKCSFVSAAVDADKY